MIFVWSSVVVFVSVASFAQDAPEDYQHKPADYDVLGKFLDKYGYKKHQVVEAEDQKVLVFMVQDPTGQSVFQFSILHLPKGNMLKIQCSRIADAPSNPQKFRLLLEKLTELNGERTVGKYCLDSKKKNVRYFYYMSVAGGICYADFRKTLGTMQYIIFNDMKAFKNLT